MKVFNGKQAANDYMSAHTLAFSTPELTLMRFSFWLGDMVPDPTGKERVFQGCTHMLKKKTLHQLR